MSLVVENNSIGIIDGALGSAGTTLTLQSMSGMPILNNVDEFCILALIRDSDNAIEYVKCTAQNIPARTYTIQRGQEGSVPLDFVDLDQARNLWTKGQIQTIREETLDPTVLREDGSVALTGDLDAGGNKIENVADAVNPDEVPNLQQVEGLIDAIPDPTGEAIRWARVSSANTSTPVVDASSGISGVTRDATGRWIVTCSTPLASKVNIQIDLMPISTTSSARIPLYLEDDSTTSAIKVAFVSAGGSYVDIGNFMVTIRELNT